MDQLRLWRITKGRSKYEDGISDYLVDRDDLLQPSLDTLTGKDPALPSVDTRH